MIKIFDSILWSRFYQLFLNGLSIFGVDFLCLSIVSKISARSPTWSMAFLWESDSDVASNRSVAHILFCSWVNTSPARVTVCCSISFERQLQDVWLISEQIIALAPMIRQFTKRSNNHQLPSARRFIFSRYQLWNGIVFFPFSRNFLAISVPTVQQHSISNQPSFDIRQVALSPSPQRIFALQSWLWSPQFFVRLSQPLGHIYGLHRVKCQFYLKKGGVRQIIKNEQEIRHFKMSFSNKSGKIWVLMFSASFSVFFRK